MNRLAQRWFERYHALARAAADLEWQWQHQRRKAERYQALWRARHDQVKGAVPLTASVSGFPPCPCCGCWGGTLAGDVLTCARCVRRWRVAFLYQEVPPDAS